MAYKVEINAAPKQLQEMMQDVIDKKIDSAKELKPIPPGVLPTLDNKQDCKMYLAGPGTWTHPTMSPNLVLTSAEKAMVWWAKDAEIWSAHEKQNVKGDPGINGTNGATLSQLFNAAKVGGYAVDEKVRDANYVEYISLANANTAALTDATKWMPTGAKDFVEVEKFDKLPQSYIFNDDFNNSSKGWNSTTSTPFVIESGALKITFSPTKSESVQAPAPLVVGVEYPISVRIRALGLLKRINVGASYGSSTNAAFYNITDLTEEWKTYNFNITPITTTGGRILIGAMNTFNTGGEIEVEFLNVGDAPYGEFKLEAMKSLKNIQDLSAANEQLLLVKNWEVRKNKINQYVKSYDYSLGRVVAQTHFRDFGYFDLTNVRSFLVSKLLVSSGGTLNIQILRVDLTILYTIPKGNILGEFQEINLVDYADGKYLRVYFDNRLDASKFVLAFSYDKNDYQIAANIQEDGFLKHQGYTVEYLDLNDLKLDGYRSITNGLWSSSSGYKSSDILTLPEDWAAILWDATNATTLGIVFFDESKTHLTGHAGASGTIQTIVKIDANDNKFRSAVFWQVSVGTGTPRKPIIKLLRKPVTKRILETGKANIILNSKVYNPNLISLSEWNTVNPSNQITTEIAFNNPTSYPNRVAWRIPMVCLTNAGTTLACCELREMGDDKGAMDLYIKRKTAGGSWETIPVYLNSPTFGRGMNPSFIVDKTGINGVVGRIYMYYFTASNNDSWATGNTRAQLDMFEIYSDNDGVSWSSPISLKSLWKPETEGVRAQVTSPANGIQTIDGTFVLPIMTIITAGGWRASFAYKKPGQNWVFTESITRYAIDNECCVWEAPDGKVLLNVRVDTAPNGRRHVYELDLSSGAIKIHKTDETFDAKHNCQMGACAVTYGGVNFYAMSYPDSIGRKNNTIFISRDLISWTRVIVLTFENSWGYTSIDFNSNRLVYAAEKGAGALQGSEIVYHDLTPLLPHLVSTLNNVFPLNINDKLNSELYTSKGWTI